MKKKILTLFGTRPEVIKLAPVIRELSKQRRFYRVVNVASGQHRELLYPLARLFRIRIHHDLRVMLPNQTANRVCARVVGGLDPILAHEAPDLVLVQGDTTTALAGALAAFHRRIPVGHVEAGLRSGDAHSPFPEEMNRRLISRLATYHFAPTTRNRACLLEEGVPEETVFVTGNPVVDALGALARIAAPSDRLAGVLRATHGYRRVVVTAHRRENLGPPLRRHLATLRLFLERHRDVALLFPVHPNPTVRELAEEIFSDHPRILLLEPLDYPDFIGLLANASLIVSDSGGIQEEAASLGKPLLVLRENTERPEAIEAGYAQLAGSKPARLAELLEDAYRDDGWAKRVTRVANPFGRGDSAQRIATAITTLLSDAGSGSQLLGRAAEATLPA